MGKQGLSEKQTIGQRAGKIGSRQLAVQTIALYQRYLSPLKGFHCAHRRLQGGLSCSEYVKQTIAAEGIKRALPLCRQRFRACRAAHETLKTWQALKAQNLLGQSLEAIVLPGATSAPAFAQTEFTQAEFTQTKFTRTEFAHTAFAQTKYSQTEFPKPLPPLRMATHSPEAADEPEPPAETLTQGEYYAPPDLNPALPPPNPLASCLVCGAIEGCCGGPSTLGGLGCGDPLEGCSCCWDGFDLSACSCCL